MVWLAYLTYVFGGLRRVGEIAQTALHLYLSNNVLYHARHGPHVLQTVQDNRGPIHQAWLVMCVLAGFSGPCPYPDSGTHSIVTDYIDGHGAIRHRLWTAVTHVSRPGRYVYFVVNGRIDMTRFFNDFDPPTDEDRLMHSIHMASAYMRLSTGPVHRVVRMTLDTLVEDVLV